MNPTQIAPFLALLGISCMQPTFAQATPDSLDESHVEDACITCDDEHSILAVLQGVEAAFSDADLPRYLSFFHSSFLIVAPAGVFAPSSEDAALSLLRPQIRDLRARGYAKSELDRTTVKLLSATTALAAVQWIRYKINKEELERLGATYAFFKGEHGWKIVMVTVYPPATLVELK